ncbi:MAG: glycosyltransferase [Firmicutes bacterium]|nr:glycosyltransferase [Bacillota bacterium]
MRIAFFSDSYHPYVSGVVRSLEITTRRLEDLGHEVWVIAPRYPGAGRDEGRIRRMPSLPVSLPNGFRLAVPRLGYLASWMEKVGFDLIHSHSPFLLGSVAFRASRRLGLPLVFTHHTLYDQYVHYAGYLGTLLRPLVIRHVLKYADRCAAVVCPSEDVRRVLSERGLRARMEVIPTGLDPTDYEPPASGVFPEGLGNAPGTPVCLYVGRLGAEKNLDLLLRAFAVTTRRVPGARLVLVGDGPFRGRLEELSVRMGLGGVVTFAGLCTRERVKSWYASADIFLFASQTETQGLVILEAMAAGLPVAAVEASGVREVVRHGVDGFLVSPDPDTLGNAAAGILTEPQLRKTMAEAAKARAREFSAAAMTGRLLSLYRTVQPSAR